jgi:hypothetical protein
MPLLKSRAWRISGAFVAAHCLAVSMLGGAVLERYLLPALPILYSAFAVALWSLPRRIRTGALAGLLICLCAANLISPIYPFPFENNLAFVSFVNLERRAATAVRFRPGTIATTFPMANAFRRREFGYVETPRKVREIADFRAESIAALQANPPDLMIVYDTSWDPLGLLNRGPGAWLMQRYYGYEPPLTAQEIAHRLSMYVTGRWDRDGLTFFLLSKTPTY